MDKAARSIGKKPDCPADNKNNGDDVQDVRHNCEVLRSVQG
jgi:hypothetical protein